MKTIFFILFFIVCGIKINYANDELAHVDSDSAIDVLDLSTQQYQSFDSVNIIYYRQQDSINLGNGDINQEMSTLNSWRRSQFSVILNSNQMQAWLIWRREQ